jgi:hypothetical protein
VYHHFPGHDRLPLADIITTFDDMCAEAGAQPPFNVISLVPSMMAPQ